MDWFFQQTSTGSTYLQVTIILAVMVFVVIPIGYITIRDWRRAIKSLLEEDSHVSRD